MDVTFNLEYAAQALKHGLHPKSGYVIVHPSGASTEISESSDTQWTDRDWWRLFKWLVRAVPLKPAGTTALASLRLLNSACADLTPGWPAGRGHHT
jgi:hypothetical protein